MRVCAMRLFLAFCLLSSGAFAQNTIHVPADQSTIQAAINAASNGDTVVVAPGTYVENVNFNGKNVVLISSGGASVTVIDGNAAAAVVTIKQGETAVVDGFTIQNGKASSGAGIEINSATATIRNNIITSNQANRAVGIEVASGTATIQGNTITSNRGTPGSSDGMGGGGIGVTGNNVQYAHATITSNTITNNTINGPGGGISLSYFSDAVIQNNYVAGNLGADGGGIYSHSYLGPTIVQNIVLNNTTHAFSGGYGGGGIFAQASQNAHVQVIGNTLYGNSSDSGPYGVYFDAGTGSTFANNIVSAASGTTLSCASTYQPGPAAISHNLAYNNTGTAWAGNCSSQPGLNGNAWADPLFSDPGNGNLHLLSGSPAIDAGNISIPQMPVTDFDGAVRLADDTGLCDFSIDMGVYESHPAASGQAAFNPRSLGFGNQPVGSIGASLPVTILSEGQGCYRVTAFILTGDFSQTNNCGAGVPAGQSCTVQVAFAPTAAGTRTGTLAVAQSTNSTSPAPVALSGTGVVPFGVASPFSLTFPVQNMNTTSAPQTVTVTNNGGDTLVISAISTSGVFAQTNNCSAPLSSTASCSVQVTFTPVQNGTTYGTLSFISNSSPAIANVSLTGQGSGPQGSLSAQSIQFYQQLLNTTSPPRTVTLTNVGGSPLTINSITAADGNGNPTTWFAQTNNCPMTLDPKANCNIQITFTPTLVGYRQGYLIVSSNSAPSVPWLPLWGYGTDTAPNMVVTPSTIDFGSVAVGQPTTQAVTVSNTGNATLTISSTVVSSPFSVTNACVGDIAPGANCVLTLMWTPQTVGTQIGSLSITSNMANPSGPFSLSGAGVQPNIVFSPATLGFGSQKVNTAGSAQTVSMSNAGGAAFSIGSFTTTNNDFAQTNNCPPTLQPGANCTVNVVFTPSAAGTRSGTLSVTGTPSGPIGAVTLSGAGAAPTATVSSTSLTFATQKVFTSATQVVTLSNSGAASLNISSISTNGAIVFTQTNDCPTTLDVGSQCSITVNFRPVQSGTYYGNVVISDDAFGTPQDVFLTGSGGAPSANVAPTSLTFGATKVGTSSPASVVTVMNSGLVALSISSISTSGDFAQSNNCGKSLGAGASCTIALTFTPTVSGARTGTLTINDDAQSGASQWVSLSGTGTVPVASVSPTSLTFSSTPVGAQSAATAVTLTNTGSAPMNIYAVGTSSNFAQSNNCGTSLAAGASCTISVTFVPTTAGSLTGQLNVNDDASPGTQTVSLSGSAVDFVINITQTSVSITAGQTASYDVKPAAVGGTYPTSITLSCFGAPVGSTCSLTQTTLTAGQAAKLKITTTKGVTPSGTYIITATGSTNGVSRSDTAALMIK